MESDQKGRFTSPLPPVVSEPIFDKKAMSDLVICRLCSCSASVLGNTQIILLCEKVAKEDITVRFFEEKNGQIVWEALGDFQHTDVHKQTAITFKTPRYHTMDITDPAKVTNDRKLTLFSIIYRVFFYFAAGFHTVASTLGRRYQRGFTLRICAIGFR